jgi:hypothetical protein
MYGLLNRAIQELVETTFGTDAWERIATKVSPEAFNFIAMKKYPDELTYDLVAAVAEESGLPAEDVMESFGEFWTTYTGHVGYGDLMKMMGNDPITFLKNLDHMHARIATIYPDLEPPKFVITELGGNRYEMEYHSHRPGLAPVVVGLIRGVGKMFSTELKLTLLEAKTQPVGYDRFELTVMS